MRDSNDEIYLNKEVMFNFLGNTKSFFQKYLTALTFNYFHRKLYLRCLMEFSIRP